MVDRNVSGGHFNAQKEISKYKLDHSTFDLIDIDRFHNTNWSTVFGYMWVWILVLLSWGLVGIDVYTCLNILVFHRWSNDDYKPYAYSVAKWIFTGCIIFQFVLLLYHWVWAIHTYRTKNIALVYVNYIAKTMYSMRSYNYYCLFNKIKQTSFFDWACFLTYNELDNALQILIADTPRQVINILTLRYYATDGENPNDIIANIKNIATHNIILSVILSFMCVSVIFFSIFFFRFCLGMILYLPVYSKLRSRGYKSLKKYCCDHVSENVRDLVIKHHRPKNELLEKGILDSSQIKLNPLLNQTRTTLDDDFDYKPTVNETGRKDKSQLYSMADSDTKSNGNYSLQDLSNPFADKAKISSKDSFGSDSDDTRITKPTKSFNRYEQYQSLDQDYRTNPFNDSQASLLNNQSCPSNIALNSNNSNPYSYNYSDRQASQSSLSYTPIGVTQPTIPKRAQTQPLPYTPQQLPRNNSQAEVPINTNFGPSRRKEPPPFSPLEEQDTQSPFGEQETTPFGDNDSIVPPNFNEPEDLKQDSNELDDVKDSTTPYPITRSETDTSIASNTPYPVRGISLYDKNYKPKERGASSSPLKEELEESEDEKDKNPGMYPTASHEPESESEAHESLEYPIIEAYGNSDSDEDLEDHRGYPLRDVSPSSNSKYSA